MLTQIKSFDIEEYLEYLKLYEKDGRQYTNNERAVKRKLSALRSMYNYYHKNKLIDENPVLQVNMPKLHDKAIVRLEANEVAQLLDTVETGEGMTNKQLEQHERLKCRDLAILTLLLGTGIRISECVGLDINDVDFNNSRIKIVRKGGYEAYVYFGDEVAEALAEYMLERKTKTAVAGHENALFLSNRSSRITVRNVEIMVKKYARIVTPMKKITPHKLRSTYGTSLYQETGDIYLVADVLGHHDVNTTKKHYAAIEENRRMSARNIVKLREFAGYRSILRSFLRRSLRLRCGLLRSCLRFFYGKLQRLLQMISENIYQIICQAVYSGFVNAVLSGNIHIFRYVPS